MLSRGILLFKKASSFNSGSIVIRPLSLFSRYFSSVNNEKLAKVRNIGVFAHIDAGKTTTTERMLFYSGTVKKLGDVDDGDTVTDFLEEERERGITIRSAAVSFPWNDNTITLIDTPGHVDFTIEVERCLRVLDGGIAVLDAVEGVEAQTETVWQQADRYNLPRLIYINKMDRMGADFNKSVLMIEQKLKAHPLVLNYPYFENNIYKGCIDVLTKELYIYIYSYLYTWDEETGKTFTKTTIHEDNPLYKELCTRRETLFESLANVNDAFATIYLEGQVETTPLTDIYTYIRQVTLATLYTRNNHGDSDDHSHTGIIPAVPILCGSSLKNKGVQPLLDAVCRYLPSPLDMPPVTVFLKNKHGDSTKQIPLGSPALLAYVFKLQYTTAGPLSFLKIYSGELAQKQQVRNTRTNKTERITRLLDIFADNTYNIQSSTAGNIISVMGLSNITTGDTLVDYKNHSPLYLEGISVPMPVFTVSIEANNERELKQLEDVLKIISFEDPTVTYNNTGQLLLSGMGELHLEVIKQRIQREFHLEPYYSQMKVAFKETIMETLLGNYPIELDVQGKKYNIQFDIELKHNNTNMANDFSIDDKNTTLFGGQGMLEAVKEGVEAGLSRGPLEGYPLSAVHVLIHANSTTFPRDTPPLLLQAALTSSIVKCLRQNPAQCSLLEPYMNIEIKTNPEKVGVVSNDITMQRRGHILNIESPCENDKFPRVTINAEVPLTEMIGYTSTLRRITAGDGAFTLLFKNYQELLPNVSTLLKQKKLL
ncbi:hypothetical protein WA158_002546 [Blastocystis sp. Blastoise]